MTECEMINLFNCFKNNNLYTHITLKYEGKKVIMNHKKILKKNSLKNQHPPEKSQVQKNNLPQNALKSILVKVLIYIVLLLPFSYTYLLLLSLLLHTYDLCTCSTTNSLQNSLTGVFIL